MYGEECPNIWTPLKVARVDNLIINLKKDVARRLHHPHDNSLVIILLIANFNTR